MKYLIAHHLGMGDHIALNGLVRHIYAREVSNGNEVWLLCYQHNLNNVKFMFMDLKLQYSIIESQTEITNRINIFEGKVEDLHLWGGQSFNYEEYADEAFCLNFNYPTSLLHEFKIIRSLDGERTAEQKLFHQYNIKDGEKFIFLHDDPKRNLLIDWSKIPKGVKVVRPGTDIPLFELLGVMEKADECHLISSSFLCIALYAKVCKNVTAHLYVKNEYLKPYLEKNGIKCLI